MIKLYPAGLPQELKDAGRWCVWRYELREGREKPTKVPFNPRTGGGAMSNNPDTFSDYITAANTLLLGGYDGLGVGYLMGFVLWTLTIAWRQTVPRPLWLRISFPQCRVIPKPAPAAAG